MDCLKCKNFDKEVECCMAPPHEVSDPICLARIQAWMLYSIWQELVEEGEDREEGNWWRNESSG